MRGTGSSKRLPLYIGWFVSALALIPLAALAGQNRWSSSGPEGAAITQIVADPGDAAIAYAVTAGGGIFKTSSAGERWRAVNDGLPSLAISALVVVPDSPATLYAATSNGIFVGTDAAEHWSPRGSIEGFRVGSLAFGIASRTLYAVIADEGASSGVYTSADGGQTWREPPSSVRGVNFSSLAVSPDGTAYAMSRDSRLFRSSDHGETWAIVASPLSDGGVVIDQESSTIYLTAEPAVFVSVDSAESWQPLPTLGNVTINSLVPAGAGHLYASTNRGIFEYSDHSRTWTSVGTSLSNVDTHALAISSSNPRRFYAAKDFGIVTNVEGESDWIAASSGLPGANANDVAVASSEPAVAFAATSPGVFKTEDNGQSWHQIQLNPFANNVNHIEVSPGTGDTVYASNDGDVLKTTDSGATWKVVAPNYASVLAVAPSDPATLYAALTSAMSKSKDGGQTWLPIMSGLPPTYYESYGFPFSATSIAVDPSNSSIVYLGRENGLYKTTDGGANWTNASKMLVNALAVEPDSSNLYATPFATGIFRSTDGGATWIPEGLIDKVVSALTLTSTNPPVLYAGTTDGHVYRSSDGGQFWRGIDNGLTRAFISRLVVDASGNHLYVATSAGVYTYNVIDEDIRVERLPEDPLRLSRLIDQLLGASAKPPEALLGTAFVLPIAGTTTGVGGTVFTTDVTLTNNRPSAQEVLVAWLPQGGVSDGVTSFRLTLPSSSDASGGVLPVRDFAERLGMSGVGSLVVIALDESANLDANASIDGTADIWTHPLGGRAPFSQSLTAVRSTLFFDHARAEAAGLRHDAAFRTNVGIVNLSSDVHQFTVSINGERASDQFTIAVPPFSLVQTAVPNGDYGTLSLVVVADSSSARWLFYGSTINNMTGEASTTIGTPSGD